MPFLQLGLIVSVSCQVVAKLEVHSLSLYDMTCALIVVVFVKRVIEQLDLTTNVDSAIDLQSSNCFGYNNIFVLILWPCLYEKILASLSGLSLIALLKERRNS